MTFTATGITGAGPKWGCGPYNVVPVDERNTPGRLISAMGMEHLHVQRTTIAPPNATDGATVLSLPQPYFGTADASVPMVVPGSDPANPQPTEDTE